MEFKEKQYDGSYEVSEVQINNQGEIFRGILYFPPDTFKKPYPLIIYFHGFPQLFTLEEIIKNLAFLLELGYSLLVFNFRGYRFNDGKVSINSQVSDGIKIVEFAEKMAERKIFDLHDINIIAQDFGAYIGLIVCSITEKTNKLLLLSPILDLGRHVYSDDFKKALSYINRFLPGMVHGIEKVEEFIKLTKEELLKKEFQIDNVIKKLNSRGFKIIIGDLDKITPLSEVKNFAQKANILPEIAIVQGMDHSAFEDKETQQIREEIKIFFS